MRSDEYCIKSLKILTAVYHAKVGPSGIGVIAANAPILAAGCLCEQSLGSKDDLYFRSILRALEIGQRFRSENLVILCPDETTVRLVNRERGLPAGNPQIPLYVRIRALMYTFQSVEILSAARSTVGSAYRLAIEASRLPVRADKVQGSLFELDDQE